MPVCLLRQQGGVLLSLPDAALRPNAETRVYRSKDPTNFGVDDDRYLVETLPVAAPEIVQSHGQLYIAALLPNLEGIEIAKLGWERKP